MLINDINQVQPVINWAMWAVIIAMSGIIIRAIVLIVKVSSNHAKLEESHKNHVDSTKDKFSAVHHRIDEKADKEVVANIDRKLDIIIDKIV